MRTFVIVMFIFLLVDIGIHVKEINNYKKINGKINIIEIISLLFVTVLTFWAGWLLFK